MLATRETWGMTVARAACGQCPGLHSSPPSVVSSSGSPMLQQAGLQAEDQSCPVLNCTVLPYRSHPSTSVACRSLVHVAPFRHLSFLYCESTL